MSLLIRSNVHLPRSCRKCPFNGGDWCIASEKVRIGKHGNVNEHRPPNYPITEIPTPHGRLIDADRLMEVIEKNSYLLKGYYNSLENGMFLTGIKQAIDEAPTIIEAEASEE